MEDMSMDLKRRVVELRKRGEILPSRRKGKGETLLVGHEETLKEWIEQQPHITLEELAEGLLEQKQVQASLATIWRKLQAMGLRHKKNGFRGRAGPS